MFLTVIHVLPDGYKSSFAKSTACFIMKYSPQQHVKMLLTEKQTGLCLRFMQPFHLALSVQINVSAARDQMDHFHLNIRKKIFRLTPRDYSVYWHVLASPSRNLCILTGQERDFPTLHLAGAACSTAYRSCCFLGLLIHGTKSFTDKKI